MKDIIYYEDYFDDKQYEEVKRDIFTTMQKLTVGKQKTKFPKKWFLKH